jgi:hypothetical protein
MIHVTPGCDHGHSAMGGWFIAVAREAPHKRSFMTRESGP